MCPWVVSKNLQEGFIQIRNVLPVRSSFSVIFTFAILIVYIIKCASVVAVLVRRRHHLVIFFIFVVVGHLELREVSTGRFGLSSSIYAICDDCGLTEFLGTGEDNSLDNGPRTVRGKDVNRRVVYAASEMGIGREDISKFCEILNMPFSMSKDTWHSHEDALLQAYTEVVQVELEKNRKEARKLAMADEGISEEDEDTVVDIPISFDGTWSKRGYTANHGIV